jgi:secernin
MCDSLCSLHADRTLFAKNSDRSPGEAQVVELHLPRPGGGSVATTYLRLPDPGALAVFGSRPTWQWGLEHGVNEKGVAIGNEQVWTVDDPRRGPVALTGLDLVRLGLERGATATQALEAMTGLIARYGQGGIADQEAGKAYFCSFLIADDSGAWILETSGSSWAARPVSPDEGGAALSNRISLAADWTRASPDVAPGSDFDRWRRASSPTAHADRRLAVTQAAVALGSPRRGTHPPAERDLARVLRDHGHGATHVGLRRRGATPVDPLPPAVIDRAGTGVSVCLHLTGVQATTASMIVSMPRSSRPSGRPIRAWVALGSPCVSIYVPIFPFDSPSADGRDGWAAWSDPVTWARFAALRQRLEAARAVDANAAQDLLEATAAQWADLEPALWAEADELARSDPAVRRRATAAMWPRVEQVLARLGS